MPDLPPQRDAGFDRATPPGPSSAQRKNKVLAFAIGSYREWQALQHPVAECRSLLKMLTDRYDFADGSVRLLTDDEANEDMLANWLYTVDDGEQDYNLIIIFSGHGYYDQAKDTGYWIPSDAPLPGRDGRINPAALRRYISTNDLVEYLNGSKAHHILLIVDSCFAGSSARIELEAPGERSADLNAPADQIPSRWVLTSGLLEKVDDQSPFASALLKALQENKRGKLKVQDLFYGLRQHLPEGCAQEPLCSNITGRNRAGGEFAFLLRPSPGVPNQPGSVKPSTVINKDQEGLESMRGGPGRGRRDDDGLESMRGGKTNPKRISSPSMKERLRLGSATYRDKLKNGRFRYFRLDQALDAGQPSPPLELCVGSAEGPLSVGQAVAAVRRSDRRHVMLQGAGGVGKTGALLELWSAGLKPESTVVPLYVALHEYNDLPAGKRSGFLLQYLLDNYLYGKRMSDKVLIFRELKISASSSPRYLLLLDGLDEVTVEPENLLLEIKTICEEAANVQVVLTARSGLPEAVDAFAGNFSKLHLLPLTDDQVRSFPQVQDSGNRPGEALWSLLRLPLGLGLFAGAKIADPAGVFSFKEPVQHLNDLLWNFAESQLAAFRINHPGDTAGLARRTFLLHHIVPYLAQRLGEAEQYFFNIQLDGSSNLLFTNLLNEAYARLDVRKLTAKNGPFPGQRQALGFLPDEKHPSRQETEKRSRQIRDELVDDLKVLVREGGTLRFLHTAFRDFFSLPPTPSKGGGAVRAHD